MLTAIAMPEPTPIAPWVCVWWPVNVRVAVLKYRPARWSYHATREAAEAAAPTDAPWSIVNIATQPARRHVDSNDLDNLVRAQRRAAAVSTPGPEKSMWGGLVTRCPKT